MVFANNCLLLTIFEFHTLQIKSKPYDGEKWELSGEHSLSFELYDLKSKAF